MQVKFQISTSFLGPTHRSKRITQRQPFFAALDGPDCASINDLLFHLRQLLAVAEHDRSCSIVSVV